SRRTRRAAGSGTAPSRTPRCGPARGRATARSHPPPPRSPPAGAAASRRHPPPGVSPRTDGSGHRFDRFRPSFARTRAAGAATVRLMRSTIIAPLAFVLALAGCVVDEELATETGAAELVIPSEPTTLVRQGSGKCLDVYAAGHANGNKINQWTCNGTVAQVFRLEPRSGGAYRFRNPHSNKCLDVAAGGSSNGTKIQLWSCSGSSNQT